MLDKINKVLEQNPLITKIVLAIMALFTIFIFYSLINTLYHRHKIQEITNSKPAITQNITKNYQFLERIPTSTKTFCDSYLQLKQNKKIFVCFKQMNGKYYFSHAY